MIIVKNRKMVVPYDDMYIGTTYDDDSERRIFRIDRYAQNERDLSALTFRLDIKQPGQQADTVILDKDIDERYIYLIWNITNSVIRAVGLMFVQIRAIDNEATVKWSTYDAALYVARHLNTPGSYTGSLTEIEQMEQDHQYMKSVVDELKDNIDYAHDAEAWAKGTRSGSAVPSTDPTYQKNSKYYSDQASTKATQAANSATAAANSATQAAETVADTNARFNNAMAAVTSETEVIDARVGADGTTYPVLKTRLDTEHTQLKSQLEDRCAEASDALSNGEYVFNEIFDNGAWGISSGQLVFSRYIGTWAMRDPYAVAEDLTITLDPSKGVDSGGYQHDVYFLNADGTFKSDHGWTTSDISVKAGDLILYEIRNSSRLPDLVQMPENEVYKLHRFKTAWQKSVDENDEIVTVLKDITALKVEATSEQIIDDRFIKSDGTLSPTTTNYKCTDFIDVSDIASDEITLSCTIISYASAVFFDEEKTVLGYINGNNASEYGITPGTALQVFTITKPSGTKYIRLSAWKNSYSDPSDLYASGYGFGNLNSRLSKVEQTVSAADISLSDMKVLVLGDSISTDAYMHYKKWVTNLIDEGFFSAENVNNISQHATGYVARYNSGNNRFIDRLSAVENKSSYDLLVIYGGTNDYIQNIPMGAVGGDADTEFIPAVKYLFEYAIQNFTQARICVISPTRTYASWVNQQGAYETDYFSQIREIAKDYCYPVLNLTEHSGFCPYIRTFSNMWTLIPDGYDVHDGVHPNAEYEKKYLAPMIKQFLKGLL